MVPTRICYTNLYLISGLSSLDLTGAPNKSTGFARQDRSRGRAAFPAAVLFHFHHEPGHGVAYANIGEFWRQLGPVDVALRGLHVRDGVVPVLNNYVYSALQPRPGAGRGVGLADLFPSGVGAVYNGYCALQVRPGAGHGEVLAVVDLLPDDAGHDDASTRCTDTYGYYGYATLLCSLAQASDVAWCLPPLPGGCSAVYNGDYAIAMQPRSDATYGDVLVDLHPDAAGHGEAFVGQLPGGGVAAYDGYGYGYHAWQPIPGPGRGEVFIGPLPDGVGVVFDGSGNFAQQTLPGAEYNGSEALADGLGAVYDDLDMAAEHLRRLLPFVGIGVSSVAVNALATGPGSPAVAFYLFALLLGGLYLVILHVLRV